MRASGEIAGDGFGDVFLVVDGWLTLRQDFEQLEQAVTAIAARGLGYGVHVLAATGKWSEFRPAIRDLFGTRLELRLGDPYESEVDRRLAMNVPESSPGRGITRDGLHFLTALPRIDSQPAADSLADGAAQDGGDGGGRLAGERRRRRVRLLPDVLPVSALPGAAQTGTKIPFGVDESTLSPVLLDFGADAHFLVFGDTECGKSNLLRLIAESVVEPLHPRRRPADLHRLPPVAAGQRGHRAPDRLRRVLGGRGPADQRRTRGDDPAAAAARPDAAAVAQPLLVGGLGPVPDRRRLRPRRRRDQPAARRSRTSSPRLATSGCT